MMGAPKALASLARYLQQRDVRIVHTNEGPMHVTWGPAARLAGRKLLWHHRSSPRAKGLRFLAPLLAHRVASVSRFAAPRSEEHTSELQSLMRISYAVFCLQNKT